MRLLVTGGSGFIGTNLMAHCIRQGVEVLNMDWNPPMEAAQEPHWREVDIMDGRAVQAVFDAFRPTHVVHLAARTDTEESDLQAYRQNHEGTRILLHAINACPSVERLVVTSTQFVCEAGYQPAHDQDFKPFTVYGESKRLTELATRDAGLSCIWTIIRPTTIWGPFSLRYRDVMFPVMERGLYFHPAGIRVMRSYGYVGNVVWQIDRMLHAPREIVHGQVFYVGDRPFDLRVWVEAVSRALTGRPVRYVPVWLVRGAAKFGDVLKAVHVPFPITTGRYRSMTSDYETPMDKTIAAFGEAPYSMEEGIQETVRWYRDGSDRYQRPARIDVRANTIGPPR